MASRLIDRLSEVRHLQFVGRDAERELFQFTLGVDKLPFLVLYIFGPGGVGKTTLLNEFAYLCEQAQASAIYVDGRNIEPSSESFLNALRLAMGLTPPAPPLQSLASQPRRCVLFIDTYELLSPLDQWLRQTFLPQLPENVLVVLASCNLPSLAWRTDPGWQNLMRILPLYNLPSRESQAYLTNRGVPSDEHQAILDFTHGHPLALSLVADTFAQRHDDHFQPQAAPDVIQTLLERLVQKVPGPAHRTALEACALVRVTTEALLAEMLAVRDPSTSEGHGAHELFEWLRRLSFIEASQAGLFPHDMVRQALTADLRWRNPDWYVELHRRARTYYASRLKQTTGHAQRRVLFDYIFLHRDNPVVRPFFEWQASGNMLTDAMRDSDVPALTAMVARHEGETSARLATCWFTRQPERVLVFREREGQPAGFLAMVALHQAYPECIGTDPGVQAVWRYLQGHAPLRPGEGATLFRFWMARDTYQAISPIQSLIFVNAVQHYLVTPGLAYTFFPCADPEFWAPVFAYADLVRIPEADFEVGGQHFGVYGHDWRVVPPLAWLGLLAEREVAAELQTTPAPNGAEPLIVLSRPEFEAAVRDALHNFTRPDTLYANSLLRSRVVAERAGAHATASERVAALESLITEAIQSLQASPRQAKCYRALYHTYLHPAPSQEQAAELLDVPFSTFRRHLTTGITRVVDILWQWEIGGWPK
jgi:energy-coupling factor transporter ATP-binding protein EcfA2